MLRGGKPRQAGYGASVVSRVNGFNLNPKPTVLVFSDRNLGGCEESAVPAQSRRTDVAMMLADRIQEFLQRLTPLTRSSLLTELERLETCGGDMPGSAEILAKLRAEFRKDGSPQTRTNNPSRYFFAPLEPLLVDGAPEHANSGRILRGSLPAIWEWISRDLLPTMARDYIKRIERADPANNPAQGPAGRRHVSDQGGQVSREHARLT